MEPRSSSVLLALRLLHGHMALGSLAAPPRAVMNCICASAANARDPRGVALAAVAALCRPSSPSGTREPSLLPLPHLEECARYLSWNATLRILSRAHEPPAGFASVVLAQVPLWDVALRILLAEPKKDTITEASLVTVVTLCMRAGQWHAAAAVARSPYHFGALTLSPPYPAHASVLRVVAFGLPSWVDNLEFASRLGPEPWTPSAILTVLTRMRDARADWAVALAVFRRIPAALRTPQATGIVTSMLCRDGLDAWVAALSVVTEGLYTRSPQRALAAHLAAQAHTWRYAMRLARDHVGSDAVMARVVIRASMHSPFVHWRTALSVACADPHMALAVTAAAARWEASLALLSRLGHPLEASYTHCVQALAPHRLWAVALGVLCAAHAFGHRNTDPGLVHLAQCVVGKVHVYGAVRFAQIAGAGVSPVPPPYYALHEHELSARGVLPSILPWHLRASGPMMEGMARSLLGHGARPWTMRVVHDVVLYTYKTHRTVTANILSLAVVAMGAAEWRLVMSLHCHMQETFLNSLDKEGATVFLACMEQCPNGGWAAAVNVFQRFVTHLSVVLHALRVVALCGQYRMLLNLLILCPRSVLHVGEAVAEGVLSQCAGVFREAPSLWWLTLQLSRQCPSVDVRAADVVDGCVASAGWDEGLRAVCRMRSHNPSVDPMLGEGTLRRLVRDWYATDAPPMRSVSLALLRSSSPSVVATAMRGLGPKQQPTVGPSHDHLAVLQGANRHGLWLEAIRYALAAPHGSLESPDVQRHLSVCVARVSRWTVNWERWGVVAMSALAGEWGRVLQSLPRGQECPEWVRGAAEHSEREVCKRLPASMRPAPQLLYPPQPADAERSNTLERGLRLAVHERQWVRAVLMYGVSFLAGVRVRPTGAGMVVTACEGAGKWAMALHAAGVLGPRHGYSEASHMATLRACVPGGTWLRSHLVLRHMDLMGFALHPEAVSLAMAACQRAGLWAQTLRIFDQHKDTLPHRRIYEVAMAACLATGLWAQAIFVFNRMVSAKALTPAPVAVHALLRACRGLRMDCAVLAALLNPMYAYVEEFHLVGIHLQHVSWVYVRCQHIVRVVC